MSLSAPDGFNVDKVNIENEYERIHDALSYADEAAPELTRYWLFYSLWELEFVIQTSIGQSSLGVH